MKSKSNAAGFFDSGAAEPVLSEVDGLRMTAFGNLCEIVAKLRAPGGCPWDREQTYATLAPMLLEEAYEAFDALEEARQGRPDPLREEIGDLLFVVTNIARQLSVEPEAALKLSNRKFRRRFAYIEAKLREQNRKFDETTLNELEELWQEAKKNG